MPKPVLWLTLASFAASAGLAMAQPGATRIDVTLFSFGYSPNTITLQRGQPYQFHFANTSKTGHDFTAKAFFAAAQVAADDVHKVDDGKVKADRGEAVDVNLVAPAPGTYEFHCSHFLHAAQGMKGEIIVR